MATYLVLDSKLAVAAKTDSFEDAHRIAHAVGLVTNGEASVAQLLTTNVAPTAAPKSETPIAARKRATQLADAEGVVAALRGPRPVETAAPKAKVAKASA